MLVRLDAKTYVEANDIQLVVVLEDVVEVYFWGSDKPTAVFSNSADLFRIVERIALAKHQYTVDALTDAQLDELYRRVLATETRLSLRQIEGAEEDAHAD